MHAFISEEKDGRFRNARELKKGLEFEYNGFRDDSFKSKRYVQVIRVQKSSNYSFCLQGEFSFNFKMSTNAHLLKTKRTKKPKFDI